MPNSYTWQFHRLDVYPTYETTINAVFQVHWILEGSDGAGHSAMAYGTQMCGPIDPYDFIPYASLTPSNVQGWVETEMGAELSAVKANLDAKIAEQISPTTLSLPPPWG